MHAQGSYLWPGVEVGNTGVCFLEHSLMGFSLLFKFLVKGECRFAFSAQRMQTHADYLAGP